ncbi:MULTISPECIES: hypothetical protein [unclassified Microbispora]|nr:MULTISPECIES: hypothetical protein [unclassified Microbispora]
MNRHTTAHIPELAHAGLPHEIHLTGAETGPAAMRTTVRRPVRAA